MKPPLSPAHGASLATTAGITAVIALVVAVGVLGQCDPAGGARAGYANAALIAFVLGAALLYTARHGIGEALDLASDPVRSGIAAARGLAFFHGGMAALFAGVALALQLRLASGANPAGWLVSGVALGGSVVALGRAASWWSEARRRSAEARLRSAGSISPATTPEHASP